MAEEESKLLAPHAAPEGKTSFTLSEVNAIIRNERVLACVAMLNAGIPKTSVPAIWVREYDAQIAPKINDLFKEA